MAIPKFLNQMRHAVQDTGDTMTGNLNFTDGNTVNINGSQTTTKDYVDGNFVNRLGGTLNDGNLYSPNIYNATQISLLNDPQADMEAATKQYVDNIQNVLSQEVDDIRTQIAEDIIGAMEASY